MSNPITVLISDVHYSVNTLELADAAFRAAIDKAAELEVPLIDLGDLTNDKAIIRGEVANRLIETFEYAKTKGVSIILLVGNHSLLNEKSHEHALNFLKPYAMVIDGPLKYRGAYFIPYISDPKAFLDIVTDIPRNSLVFTHQGYLGAHMGDYIQDKSSTDPAQLRDYKIFSGHYHKHQQIESVTYVGNPYTLSFGEANDGPKGFLILNDDYSFTREILNLRKHITLEVTPETIGPMPGLNQDDLLWLKVKGSYLNLKNLDKEQIGKLLLGHSNFKIDLIPNDIAVLEHKTDNMSSEQILDALIDNLNYPSEDTNKLKDLWKKLLHDMG